MVDYYILDDKRAVKCDLMVWAKWMESGVDRHVADTTKNGVRISTVFLGLDHNYFSGNNDNPLIFETMAFNAKGDDIFCERCSTWEQAEAQHEKICKQVA